MRSAFLYQFSGTSATRRRRTAERQLKECVRITIEQRLERELLAPLFRDARLAIVRARELPVDSCCGVGVVSQVHRQQAPFAKVTAAMERPKRGLERLRRIAASA